MRFVNLGNGIYLNMAHVVSVTPCPVTPGVLNVLFAVDGVDAVRYTGPYADAIRIWLEGACVSVPPPAAGESGAVADALVRVAREAASAPGSDWLTHQLRLADVLLSLDVSEGNETTLTRRSPPTDAPAVDAAAVRAVVKDMRAYAYICPLPSVESWADRLDAALGDKSN